MAYTSMTEKIINNLWKLFLSGLFAILPLTLTVAIFSFSFRLLKSWLEPLYRLEPAVLKNIPHSEIFITILIILLVGTILRIFLLRSILHALDNLVSQVPLIRTVYTGIKQLVHAFNVQDKITFQRVVLVEFPRPEIFSLGFVTSELSRELAPNQAEKFLNIFVPTTPNPTSGFFIIVAENNVRSIDLTRQEAMSMIISGGIIKPDRFNNHQS